MADLEVLREGVRVALGPGAGIEEREWLRVCKGVKSRDVTAD